MSMKKESEWLPMAAIAAVFAAGWVLVGGGADVPVIDDWVHAWGVEQLLKTGRLQILEFCAMYPIAETLWGALFARVAGLSFGALRLSTVVLAAGGCAAVYFTLRALGCGRSASLIGALALACDPLFFAMSFTFMTEVPFVSFAAMATYFVVRASTRDSIRSLWVATAFSIAAYLARPIALVLPPAMLLAACAGRDWRPTLRRWAAPMLVSLTAMLVLQFGLPRLLGPLDWASERSGYLEWWFSIPITVYLRWTLEILLIGAFPFVPVLLGYAIDRRSLAAVGITAIAVAIVCHFALAAGWTPIPNYQTWSLQDIGARAMIDGRPPLSPWSIRVMPLAKAIGVIALASLVVILVRGLLARPAWTRAQWFVLALGAGHIALIHVLWFYNDRYYLALAPVFAVVAAQAIDRSATAQWVAAALLVLWAGIAVTGTRDMLAFNAVLAKAAHELEAQGVPPSEIDVGYVLNGWRLYAHSENLPPGADRRSDVPYVTSRRTTLYSVTNAPRAGAEVIRVIPLPAATWQASRQVYVVKNNVR